MTDQEKQVQVSPSAEAIIVELESQALEEITGGTHYRGVRVLQPSCRAGMITVRLLLWRFLVGLLMRFRILLFTLRDVPIPQQFFPGRWMLKRLGLRRADPLGGGTLIHSRSGYSDRLTLWVPHTQGPLTTGYC
jgi:hypothetical protein